MSSDSTLWYPAVPGSVAPMRYARASTAMPASRAMRTITITVSVVRAFFTAGLRNAPTPLLTASTPVIAVQPLANARSTIQLDAAAVAAGSAGGATTAAGDPPDTSTLIRPISITPPRLGTNAYVG